MITPAHEMGSSPGVQSDAASAGGAVRLRRRFGLPYCVALLVGFIIGSGIYISPAEVLKNVPSPGLALLLWGVAGVVALLGALTNAELGTTYPSAGDKYVYMKVFYGDFFGFIFLWQYLFLTRPGANVIKCLVFAQYITYPLYSDCSPHPILVSLIGSCLAMLVTALNCYNITWAGKLQGVCAALTVTCLLIISGTGFVYIGRGQYGELHNAFDSSKDWDLGTMFLGFYSLVYTYGGWFALNYLVEEMRDPYRNLPLGIVISMCIVMALYMGVNIAYLSTMSITDIIESDAVAMTFATKTLASFSWVIAILIACNNAGSLNCGILVASRLCFAGGRAGHLPRMLSLINIRSYSPITALLMQLVIMVIMCFTADVYTLLNNFVFINTAIEMMTAYGWIYRRFKQPNLHRPLKLPLLVPLVFAVFQTVLVVGPLMTKPTQTGLGLLIVLATGIPYYLLFVVKIVPLRFMEKYNEFLTVLLQRSLWCSPQEGQSPPQEGQSLSESSHD